MIRRNCVVGIAQKVAERQALLTKAGEAFNLLEEEIALQEASLHEDSSLIENDLLNKETEERQAELRRRMQATEKKYIDVKFECYHFLSETLK